MRDTNWREGFYWSLVTSIKHEDRIREEKRRFEWLKSLGLPKELLVNLKGRW